LTAALSEQWQKQITINAASLESLAHWHSGMAQLADLTHKLNWLDEKRGRYMAVSELKPAVFNLTQTFNKNPRQNQAPSDERKLNDSDIGDYLCQVIH
jgi:type VI secretion system protein VasL